MDRIKQILPEMVKEKPGTDYTRLLQEMITLLQMELQQMVKVRSDEVAILLMDRQKNLRFFRPYYLEKAGAIPASYTKSFVTKVLQTQRATLDNRFHATAHLALFEDFKQDNPNQLPIQKMMCIPLVTRTKIAFGAVEVSRKGATPDSAGRDWTDADWENLTQSLREISDDFFRLVRLAGVQD